MATEQAQVDPEASAVRCGAQSWPFELDPATGGARLLLGAAPGDAGPAEVQPASRVFRLRPLRWREKLALARFAHLGPAYLRRLFLRLTAEGDGPLPDDAAQLDALWALAAWLNDPSGSGQTLPLDPVALARAVLDVCRTNALRPADLDERDALDVELLWQASHGAGSGEPAGSAATVDQGTPDGPEAQRESGEAGQIRILVVPDPTPDQATGSRARTQEARTPRPERDTAAGPPDTPPDRSRLGHDTARETRAAFRGFRVLDPETEERSSESSGPVDGKNDDRQAASLTYDGDTDNGDDSRSQPGFDPVPAADRRHTRGAGRGKAPGLRPPSGRQMPAAPLEAPPAAAPGPVITPGPAENGGMAGPAASTPAAGAAGMAGTAAHMPAAAKAGMTTAMAADGAAGPSPGPHAGGTSLSTPMDKAEASPGAGSDEREQWFEVLSERLAQAAADLGIDVEA